MNPARTFHHQNLSWARLRRGLDQAELAKLIGVSTRSIKGYEGAAFAPATEPLRRLAKVLKFPEGFFFADAIGDIKKEAVSFRSGSSLIARQRDMALGSAAVAVAFNREAERFFALPEAKLPDYSARDPERAAELLRGRWDLGAQPVGALMPLLEDKGIRIFSLPQDVSEANTFSFWHGHTPFIFLKNGQAPGALRADLAYELAHLVLHRSGQAATKAAHEAAKFFAEAFMLPADDMLKLGSVTDLSQFAIAGAYFGTPPTMLARRLHHLGALSEWKFRALRTALEQSDIKPETSMVEHDEQSALLPRIFASFASRGITKHRYAHILGLYPSDLNEFIPERGSTSVMSHEHFKPKLSVVSVKD